MVNSSENYFIVGFVGLGIIQILCIVVCEVLCVGWFIEVLFGYCVELFFFLLVYLQCWEFFWCVNLFMQWLVGVMKEYLD